MGIELELAVLLASQTLGLTIFGVFETETALWKRLAKWVFLIGGTLGLYAVVGHWALIFPGVMLAAGLTFHFYFCRKMGIQPVRATPRKKYYELRGWPWPTE